jgi:hypothetical protein
MTAITPLIRRRQNIARAVQRQQRRKPGAPLQPKEPLFYGRNRREERRSVGEYLRQNREHEQGLLARLQRTAPWECAEALMYRRIRRVEQAFSARRLKAAYARLEAGVPLHRAEQRLANLYDTLACVEADRRMWRNAF